MRLWICGTDERSVFLRQIAQERGYETGERNPDAVILPLPRASYSDLKRQYPAGQRIVCGMIDETIKKEAVRHNWNLQNVMEDEGFVLENAHLTAEGAVFKAMHLRKKALCRAKCLVVGFGRIGKYLTQMLRGMGAEVTVAARKESARQEAGKNSVDIREISDVIGKMDFLFNTVPVPILEKSILEKAKKDIVLMELASAPYGFDMADAEKLGLKIQIEGGLPGRYCPRDAAEAWMDSIERSVQK